MPAKSCDNLAVRLHSLPGLGRTSHLGSWSDGSRLWLLVVRGGADPFNGAVVAHAADLLILATWFMLREAEIAAAGRHCVGQRELTRRTLLCSCKPTVHPGTCGVPPCGAHATGGSPSRLAPVPGRQGRHAYKAARRSALPTSS